MEKVILLGTTIFMSIVMFVSVFWINKFSNNGIIFGVRVPKEYEKDEDILKLEKEYKKNNLIFILPLIIIVNILVAFTSKISIFLLLTFVVIIVANIPVFIMNWKWVRNIFIF